MYIYIERERESTSDRAHPTRAPNTTHTSNEHVAGRTHPVTPTQPATQCVQCSCAVGCARATRSTKHDASCVHQSMVLPAHRPFLPASIDGQRPSASRCAERPLKRSKARGSRHQRPFRVCFSNDGVHAKKGEGGGERLPRRRSHRKTTNHRIFGVSIATMNALCLARWARHQAMVRSTPDIGHGQHQTMV
jgi:hypothetical protein